MKKLILFAVCMMGLAASQVANAITYEFNSVLTGGTPAGTAPWATLEVTQVGVGVVSLRLDAVNLPGTEFISLFEYNIAGSGLVTVSETDTTGGVDPSNGGAGNGFHFGSFTDAGLSFNADVDFPPPPGNSSWKFTGGEYYEWQLSRSGLTVDDIDVPMLLHIQSIGTDGSISSKVYPTVPDGGTTAALLGIGMLALGALRRRLA